MPGRQAQRFDNDRQGIAQLVQRLEELQPLGIVLEATGSLEFPLAAQLALAGLPVAIVNPRQVRDFAKALGRLAKTDTIDAQVLAHFAQAVRPPARSLTDPQTRELRAIADRRRQLVEMLTAEGNRRRTAPARSRPQLDEHIRWLKSKITDIDQDLQDLIQLQPSLEGAGATAAQCAGGRPYPGRQPPGPTARIGPLEPRSDSRSRRCGPTESGQRHLPRPAQDLGR